MLGSKRETKYGGVPGGSVGSVCWISFPRKIPGRPTGRLFPAKNGGGRALFHEVR